MLYISYIWTCSKCILEVHFAMSLMMPTQRAPRGAVHSWQTDLAVGPIVKNCLKVNDCVECKLLLLISKAFTSLDCIQSKKSDLYSITLLLHRCWKFSTRTKICSNYDNLYPLRHAMDTYSTNPSHHRYFQPTDLITRNWTISQFVLCTVFGCMLNSRITAYLSTCVFFTPYDCNLTFIVLTL